MVAQRRGGSRKPLALALLLGAAALAMLASETAFLQPPTPTQRPMERREALSRALLGAVPLVAAGTTGVAPVWARWSGKYKDPKFPGCERRITKDGDIFVISGTSPTDGSKKCEEGAPTKRWSLQGKLPEGTVGPGDEMFVDFSSKGGPTDVSIKWDKNGIIFPGNNKWTKLENKPGTTGLVAQ